MADRDTCSDTGRMGDGSNVQRAERLGHVNSGASTVAEQNALGGYNKTDLPEGGQRPMQTHTTGSRGTNS